MIHMCCRYICNCVYHKCCCKCSCIRVVSCVLWNIGSIQWWVFFAEYRLFYRALLQWNIHALVHTHETTDRRAYMHTERLLHAYAVLLLPTQSVDILRVTSSASTRILIYTHIHASFRRLTWVCFDVYGLSSIDLLRRWDITSFNRKRRDSWDMTETWLMRHDSWDMTHESWLRRHDSWDMTHETWLMRHDSWVMTHETWLMSHDSWDMTHESWIRRWDITSFNRKKHRYKKRDLR